MKLKLRVRAAFVGEGLELRHGACIHVEGEEVYVGSSASCTEPFADFSSYVAAPAPINMHVHLLDFVLPEYSLSHVLSDVVAPPDGAKHKLIRGCSEGELKRAVELACNASANYGCGGLVEFREVPLRDAKCAKEVPVHVILGRVYSGFTPGELREVLERCNGIGLPSPLGYSEEELRTVSSEVKSRGLLISTHIAEEAVARERGDLELALEHLKPDFIVHGNYLSEDDVYELAKKRVGVVVVPMSADWFGLKMPPLKELLDEGLIVGLGSDNAGLHTLDIWEHVKSLTYAFRRLYSGFKAFDRLAHAIFIKPYLVLRIVERCDEVCFNLALIDDTGTRISRSASPQASLLKRVSSRDVVGVVKVL